MNSEIKHRNMGTSTPYFSLCQTCRPKDFAFNFLNHLMYYEKNINQLDIKTSAEQLTNILFKYHDINEKVDGLSFENIKQKIYFATAKKLCSRKDFFQEFIKLDWQALKFINTQTYLTIYSTYSQDDKDPLLLQIKTIPKLISQGEYFFLALVEDLQNKFTINSKYELYFQKAVSKWLIDFAKYDQFSFDKKSSSIFEALKKIGFNFMQNYQGQEFFLYFLENTEQYDSLVKLYYSLDLFDQLKLMPQIQKSVCNNQFILNKFSILFEKIKYKALKSAIINKQHKLQITTLL